MKNQFGKRKNERRQCFVPVEGKKGSSFEDTQTVDISKGGIGFVSSHSLSFKQKIPIELAFSPDSDPVLVMGEVKWIHPLSGSKKYRVGMTFTRILSGSKSRLDKYFQNKF
ncbi:MAG TPA: PilZ domain-containing protein [Candidatus Omnitrophota bacterium]|nr:PilZ domain-containing protein [Candidatus Omnitrophota bacterium]